MFCPKCSNEDLVITQEKKGISGWAIAGAIFFFPIGLLFLLIRKSQHVAICRKCGNKFDINS